MTTFRRNHSRIVDDIPKELREQVERMFLEGDTTYDGIKAWLAARGYDISRSAIGRYGKVYFNTYKSLRIMEDQAKALVSEAGDGMAMEEAVSKMMLQQVLSALMDESLDVKAMPRIISDFAKLQTSTVNREKLKKELEEEIRKQERERAKKETMAAIDKAEEASGGGAMTVARFKEIILNEYGVKA